jgi:hypothetical protein
MARLSAPASDVTSGDERSSDPEVLFKSEATTPEARDAEFNVSQPKDDVSGPRDLEKASPAASSSDEDKPADPNLVEWDGADDPANPKNWPMKRRWRTTVLVSLFAFIASVSSSMVSPALGKVGEDLHIQKQLEVEMALSIFVLGFGVG